MGDGLLTLSRRYRAHAGAPVLHAVHPEVFLLRYFTDCMACNFCHDSCCAYGVDVDRGEVDRLRLAEEALRPYVSCGASDWFAPGWTTDSEFPSGAYTRTTVVDGACVFRNKTGRGCAIHAYSLDAGVDYHLLKPMVSVLFPLTFDEGVLHAADDVSTGLVCAGRGPTLFEGVRPELLYYFDASLVGELDAIAERLAEEQT